MSWKRALAAVGIFLYALLIRYGMPEAAEAIYPALKEAVGQMQAFTLPSEAVSWLRPG